MTCACIGLGSNVGDRLAHLRGAVVQLGAHPGIRVRRCSSVYRTVPWGEASQPEFLNAVAQLETALAAPDLLAALLAIERAHGRRRDVRWGPRTLDLDLLLYGDAHLDHPDLTVPHPRLRERAFVLVPLLELAPDLVLPGDAEPAARLLATCVDRDAVTRLEWTLGTETPITRRAS